MELRRLTLHKNSRKLIAFGLGSVGYCSTFVSTAQTAYQISVRRFCFSQSSLYIYLKNSVVVVVEKTRRTIFLVLLLQFSRSRCHFMLKPMIEK